MERIPSPVYLTTVDECTTIRTMKTFEITTDANNLYQQLNSFRGHSMRIRTGHESITLIGDHTIDIPATTGGSGDWVVSSDLLDQLLSFLHFVPDLYGEDEAHLELVGRVLTAKIGDHYIVGTLSQGVVKGPLKISVFFDELKSVVDYAVERLFSKDDKNPVCEVSRDGVTLRQGKYHVGVGPLCVPTGTLSTMSVPITYEGLAWLSQLLDSEVSDNAEVFVEANTTTVTFTIDEDKTVILG